MMKHPISYGVRGILLLLGGVMLIVVLNDFQTTNNKWSEEIEEFGRLARIETDHYFRRHETLFRAVSQNRCVLERHQIECSNYFRQIKDLFPNLVNMVMSDRDGKIIASARPIDPAKPLSIKNQLYFKALAAGQTRYVMDPHVGPISNNAYVTGMGIALKTASGEFDGFLGASMDFNEIMRLWEEFPERLHWYRHSMVIIGRYGTIIGSTRDLQSFVNQPVAAIGNLAQAVANENNGTLTISASAYRFHRESATISKWLIVTLAPRDFTLHDYISSQPVVPLFAIPVVTLIGLALWLMRRNNAFIQYLLVAEQTAEAANYAKSAFLANMSHELRNPMNAILGFSRLIYHDRTLNPEHKKHLSVIRRSGEHLLTLINDVLDMSKIEAGRITLNENIFNLYRMLDELKGMLGFRAEKKGLSLIFEHSPDVPQYVRTDETKLRQVLINLIGNAIKFTNDGGVAVRAEKNPDLPGEPEVCSLHFKIEDTGPGITPEETDILFEPFAQTQAGRHVQEGTGLGLPISRKFVQLMSGDITVRSEVGKGTIFGFHILIHIADAGDVESQAYPRRAVSIEPGQPRYKILIADDNADNRNLLVKILNPFGFDLREAENGQEAVEIWQEWRPNLIWMDIKMPVMDGYEAMKTIRNIEKKDPKCTVTVIIAQSASTFEEERSIILEAGCNDFLRKPFRESDIFELMRKHMGVRFIYEEAETENKKPAAHEHESTPLSPEDFSDIPNDLLKRLKQAAIDTDMEEVDGIMHEIRVINSDIADQLNLLADDFEYSKIVRIIEDSDGCHNGEKP